MPLRATTFQTNFSSGQLDPRMMSRSDVGVYNNSGENLLNNSPLVQGGARRRPGSDYLAALTGHTRLEKLRFNETQLYVFAFSNTELKIFNSAGSLLQTLTSQPWSATTMWEMRLTSAGDTTIITHEDFAMQKLLRTGASTFTIAAYAFESHSSGYPRYQPFYKFADDSTTLTPSATSGSGVTLTASAASFVSAHVGSIVRYKGKECDVTGFTDTTHVTVTVRETLSGTSADTDWDENVFSAARGYAKSCAFHPRRLWFGGSRDLPSHLFSSQSNAFFNFNVGTGLDAEIIQAPLGSDSVSEILHLHSGRHLTVFTDSGIYYIQESNTTPVSPSNFNPRFTVPYGSAQAPPKRYDGATLFIQDTGKVVRELLWNDLQQSYTAEPISLVSNDMINDVQDQEVFYGNDTGPEQFNVIVNADGNISIYHSVRSEKIAAWFPWETIGDFESVTELNGEIFVSVKRDNKNVRENGTITVTDYANIAVGTTITITIADGTAYTFTSEASSGSSPSESTGWRPYSNNDTTADNIYTTINSHSLFTVANPSANIVTITESSPTGLLTIETSDSTRLAVSAQTYQQVYYLEKFNFLKTVDCSATLSNVSGNIWGGLSHLLNSSVSCVDSNIYHGDFTVASTGRITLNETGTAPVAGLNFTRKIIDMPANIQGPNGSLRGSQKMVGEIIVEVYDTANFAVNGQEFLIRQVDDDLSTSPSSVTGTYQFYGGGWSRDAQVTITQTAPLKGTILSIWKEILA